MSDTPLSPADFTLLCDVIRAVARNGQLSPEDAEDFSQSVHLKLLEKNYAPLTQFQGRSSLRTFLVTVVHRMLLDWRNARYGKWRPSAASRRLGPLAMEIERLVARDGLSRDEAVKILRNRPGAPDSVELTALAGQLRIPRRTKVVTDVDVEQLTGAVFGDPIEAEEASKRQQKAFAVLRRACRDLGGDDRRLLHLRFARGLPVSAIAATVGSPSKRLYRRIERLLAIFRESLLAAGVVRGKRVPGKRAPMSVS